MKKSALILLAAAVPLAGCTRPAGTGRDSSDGKIRLTEELIVHPPAAAERLHPCQRTSD